MEVGGEWVEKEVRATQERQGQGKVVRQSAEITYHMKRPLMSLPQCFHLLLTLVYKYHFLLKPGQLSSFSSSLGMTPWTGSSKGPKLVVM